MQAKLLTPGRHPVSVNIIEKRHEVKDSGQPAKLVPLLDNTGIKFTAECIKEFVDNKRNCNILITGDPGLGKSTLIAHLATTIDPNFDVDKVAFWLDEFERIFHALPYGTKGVYPQVSMDESAHALYGPEYMKKEQRVVAKNMIISRKKRNIIYFATPKRKFLNPHVRELVHIWIHVMEPQMFLPGYARVRFAPPDKQSEYYPEKYWEPKYAFIFPEYIGPFWERYEAKKIAFLDDATRFVNKERELLMKVIWNMHCAGYTQSQIGQIVELDRTTVSHLLSDIQRNSNVIGGTLPKLHISATES